MNIIDIVNSNHCAICNNSYSCPHENIRYCYHNIIYPALTSEFTKYNRPNFLRIDKIDKSIIINYNNSQISIRQNKINIILHNTNNYNHGNYKIIPLPSNILNNYNNLNDLISAIPKLILFS